MKFKFILVIHVFLAGCLGALEIRKEGLIPAFNPIELGISMYFLPYNAKVCIVGDGISNLSQNVASALEVSSIYSISSNDEDYKRLLNNTQNHPNIHPYFGVLSHLEEGIYSYYMTLPHEKPYQGFLRFPGSLLKPCDSNYPFLFGEVSSIRSFSLTDFCVRENLEKIHFLSLNCGGNEYDIIKSNSNIINNCIVVWIKTYMKPIRENISSFEELHNYMLSHGFELLTHHIYNETIGDALYVKTKYINAVFRSREI